MAVVLPPLVWKPSPNHSTRHGVTPDLLVWHETAGSYAGAVSWLCTPTVYNRDGSVKSGPNASAHIIIDEHGVKATQIVRLADKAWTEGDFNARGVGVECANITAKGYATEAQLEVSARVFGWLCIHLAIPPRFARGGVGRGVCRHLDLGAAGGGHTQCGPSDATWERFLVMLHHEVERGGYKRVWAR